MSSAPPSVSVIVCTWNRCDTLRESLLSLRGQVGVEPGAVEVIVVDNNSSDGTRGVVEALATDWPLGRLRYAFEGRQGKQFALNLGVSLAMHPVLAFTDDDIAFPSDWLVRVRELFRDEGIALAGGKTLIRWGPQGRPAWFADDMLAILAGVDLGDRRLDPAPPEYAPGGSNLIARRTLFERVGGYSETHFRHMDYEFGMRCQARGERLVYDPGLVVHAPVDERCLTLRYFRRWSFKAGIAASNGALKSGRPKLPLWLYRRTIEDALSCLAHGFQARTPERFSRELRLWRGWGRIANAWHAWLAPGNHAEWVKSRSQKSNGMY